jgi:site-specific DNA-methyltransferase (adenine-specific)
MNTQMDLHLGDCISGMSELAADSVDLIVTSPPYNLGIKYSRYDDSAGREDYLRWSRRWCEQARRVLKPNGSFFLNVGACPSNPFLPHELVLQLRDLFVLQNTIHWIKSITITTRKGEEISAGHFKPISSRRYLNDCHEYLFHLTKSGTVPLDRRAVGVSYADKSNIARWGHTDGLDKRCRGNNWFIPYKTILNRESERPHPATFPVELAEMCIRLHGGGSELVVMDPFLGIGHAALAAKTCGVARFIGFEIDPEYMTAAKRLVEETSEEHLLCHSIKQHANMSELMQRTTQSE